MSCYHPLPAFRSGIINPSGKESLVFKPQGFRFSFEFKRMQSQGLILEMPCGKCIGCRLDYAGRWALRCMHEASLYENNCFLTLTYRPEKLPPGGTLVLSHFQLFMKRLRKRYGSGIRVVYCGEYGDVSSRPHYHALLFNFDFPDKSLKFTNSRGDKVFESESLDRLWTDPSDGVNYGQSRIGSVTFESASYVARYVTKKLFGRNSDKYCRNVDRSTGEILDDRLPEFFKTSRQKGIGRDWFEKHRRDVFPNDFCLVDRSGKFFKRLPPSYYLNLFELVAPEKVRVIKEKRVAKGLLHAMDRTPARLAAREFCELEKVKHLKKGCS